MKNQGGIGNKLGNLFAHKRRVRNVTVKENATEIAAYSATDPFLWLGKQPALKSDLIEALNTISEGNEHVSDTIEKFSGTEAMANAIIQSYQKSIVTEKIIPMYELLKERLEENGIDIQNLRVVCMNRTGGTPTCKFGFIERSSHGTIEEAVERQLHLATNFSFIYDVLPFDLHDSAKNLDAMAVCQGAILLSKLLARDAGRMKVDGMYFSCKGTPGVAHAVRNYIQGNPQAPIPCYGQKTEFQGFFDRPVEFYETHEVLPSYISWFPSEDQYNLVPMMCMNSIFDGHLESGSGREVLRNFFALFNDDLHTNIDFTFENQSEESRLGHHWARKLWSDEDNGLTDEINQMIYDLLERTASM